VIVVVAGAAPALAAKRASLNSDHLQPSFPPARAPAPARVPEPLALGMGGFRNPSPAPTSEMDLALPTTAAAVTVVSRKARPGEISPLTPPAIIVPRAGEKGVMVWPSR
jgi:hypothetical protein